MRQIKFVTGVKKEGRIVDTSPRAKKMDIALFEKAFNARPVGSSSGLDLFSIRESMTKLLNSSGGRPSLAGAGAQVKIPKIDKDWEKIDELVLAASDLPHKPSPTQVAAIVLHLALGCIPEKDIEDALRREYA